MQANKPVQFTCLAIEGNSGDIVCAGGSCTSDVQYNIYVWSLRTGQLMEILNGHTAPVSCLQFNQAGVIYNS